MAHSVNGIVNGRIFFNIGICLGQIGFGLVIIVITHKVGNCIGRKKGFKLIVQLSRKGFIVGNHQRGFLEPFNHVGHGKGFSRTRYPKENLVLSALLDPMGELINCPLLVSFQLKIRDQFKLGHGKMVAFIRVRR